MRLTVYGGAGEVGGNQILLQEKSTSLMLDFGRNFNRESKYFTDPFLQARELEDLRTLELLPPLDYLYKKEGESPVSAILLSHAHLDHMDYIRYIRNPHVRVWAGEGTWRIICAREIIRPRRREYRLAEAPGREHEREEKGRLDGIPIYVNFGKFRTGDEFQVGEFNVCPVHVDHSVPGSYGYIIEGKNKRIAYTGDLRFHGFRPELSEDFVREAEEVDLLIMEGTNVLENKPSSEKEVEGKVRQVVERTKGLVAASFSCVDVDRMRTFYKVARDAGRKFVISMKQAQLLDLIRPEIERGRLEFPWLEDRNFLIYCREKERYMGWEQELMDRYQSKIVSAEQVSEKQKEVLLYATYYDMFELLEIKPMPDSVFIYSESEPWNEEGEIEFQKLGNWLELLGMPLVQVHASGHASVFELKRLVQELKPEKVVIVHSDRPELFKRFVGDEARVVAPQWGKEIDF